MRESSTLVRVLKIVIALAILATIVHDASYYALALYELRDTTRQAAGIAASAARGGADRNGAWRTAESFAEKNGATIYGYEQSRAQIQIWTRAPVTRLWALAYVNALFTREPLGTPMAIQEEEATAIE
jgi:hypothetical protein